MADESSPWSRDGANESRRDGASESRSEVVFGPANRADGIIPARRWFWRRGGAHGRSAGNDVQAEEFRSDDAGRFETGPQGGDIFRAGRVTATTSSGATSGREHAEPGPIVIDLDPQPEPAIDPTVVRRRTIRMFAGAAGAVLAVGITVVLAMTLTGNGPLRHDSAAPPPPDTRPQLARLCPPPPNGGPRLQPAPPTPSGARTTDTVSGISYAAFSAPWLRWNLDWSDAGDELAVNYRTGQYFVTEQYPEGDYLATILSASVPVTTNDALAIDLKCTGTQVAADARTAFYPQPNTMDPIRNEQTTLGGMPAWVSEFRLHFHAPGLKATSELVMLATIDVGKPSAAILYVSIPDTNSKYDFVINELLASIRPAG